MAERLWSQALIVLGILAVLAAVISPSRGENGTVFCIGKYREMHDKDKTSLEFVLGAMRETVFFAQHSIDRPVIGATPIPIAGTEFVEIVDHELEHPTNPDGGAYTDATQVVFVLLKALKQREARR